MNNKRRVYNARFGDTSFEITCSDTICWKIADFLFRDFPGAETDKSIKRYEITSKDVTLSLKEGDKTLYSGNSTYKLAYTLMNEVIYHCIDTNTRHHALHAGAVWRGDRCILLPGTSGNGKSSMTSWLIQNGYQYLTDELVFLDNEARITPMTRPISLKVGPKHASWLLGNEHEGLIISDSGSMIPHREFNPVFNAKKPIVTDIIFPCFDAEAKYELVEISPGKSSLQLLQSHVNARNLVGHGVSELIAIVKQCRSFTFTYSSFEDLHHIFHSDSKLFT